MNINILTHITSGPPVALINENFLKLGANYAIFLNESNFLASRFSTVFYCFATKTIKHKISNVFTVTCVDVVLQIEQSSCTI